MAFIDLTGKVYERLTCISVHSKGGTKGSTWNCLCACGNTHIANARHLKSGGTKSCGCLNREIVSKACGKHKDCRSKEYRCWRSFKGRCNNPNEKSYHRYGGRGISVCDRWVDSYENFLADMGRAPTKMHTIERMNNNGNYDPKNCRWATYKEQANNNRRNINIFMNGETHTAAQWCDKLNISRYMVYNRIHRGCPIDEHLFESIK